jgi:hypothetical protein
MKYFCAPWRVVPRFTVYVLFFAKAGLGVSICDNIHIVISTGKQSDSIEDIHLPASADILEVETLSEEFSSWTFLGRYVAEA